VLVIFRGLPGTGKSYLIRHLVERRAGLHVLSRDVLRVAVIPHPAFSDEEKAFVDELVAAMAGWLTGHHRDVVIDGAALSSAAGVQQLVDSARGSGASGDRGEALYFRVKARFERLTHPCLTVDTDRGLEENLRSILAFLQTGTTG